MSNALPEDLLDEFFQGEFNKLSIEEIATNIRASTKYISFTNKHMVLASKDPDDVIPAVWWAIRKASDRFNLNKHTIVETVPEMAKKIKEEVSMQIDLNKAIALNYDAINGAFDSKSVTVPGFSNQNAWFVHVCHLPYEDAVVFTIALILTGIACLALTLLFGVLAALLEGGGITILLSIISAIVGFAFNIVGVLLIVMGSLIGDRLTNIGDLGRRYGIDLYYNWYSVPYLFGALSDEASAVLVEGAYQRVLERSADETGLSVHIPYLISSDDVRALIKILGKSDEHFDRFIKPNSEREVAILFYKHFLARTPGEEEIGAWLNYVKKNLKESVDYFVNSYEYISRFGKYHVPS